MYVLIGGLFLAYANYNGEITDEMRQVPHMKYIVMGGLGKSYVQLNYFVPFAIFLLNL